jgi:hypothetical protein
VRLALRVKDWGIGACIDSISKVMWLGDWRGCTSGKSTQKALMFMAYRKAPKFSLNLPSDSLRSWRCMKLASRSAMLSLSSANAGSRLANGKSEVVVEVLPLGVVWEARSEVRDGGRRGVVGRRVREVLR